MARIELTQGKYMLVDDEDVAKLSQWSWYAGLVDANNWYGMACPSDGSSRKLYAHRIVMDAPEGMVVHHIDGNTLDNRKENLLLLTVSQHMALHAEINRLKKLSA